MAYDRYGTRDAPRDERWRWPEERFSDRERGWRGDDRGRRDERGFFERAGDEIASWFGDDDAERRSRQDQTREEQGSGLRPRERGPGRDRADRDWNDNRGLFARGGSSEADYNASWRRELGSDFDRERGYGRDRSVDRDRGYSPMATDYGRSEQFSAASRARSGFGEYRGDYDRSQTPWGRDEYRRTTFAGSPELDREFDPHYRSWRNRHLSELDRDYDDYRRENQSRFERDFGSWRERRMQKRALLGQIREHMEVLGNDQKHVGTIDRAVADRIILAKSDPQSGGVSHSLSSSDIDRIEGDRVILDWSAEQARERWRDESRDRALFEREDQGEMGPRVLDRSFEGTYR